MSTECNYDRVLAAHDRVRDDLLRERTTDGHWIGELSTSALSTATAVSALALVERHDPITESGRFANEAREGFLSELIVDGINWLADHQNEDGGWGDTDKSHSNIATTMLAVAAFHLTGVPVKHATALEKAQEYIDRQGGIEGLKRRYGKDKTFAVTILTNCALDAVVPWSKVSPLPFELACFPQSWYRFLRMPVVSYAIPALVAIGQCRFFHGKPWNPIMRMIRSRSVEPSLDVLQKMQPASGGYLEAIPLTSFVVMSLASIGRVKHPVTQAGLEFIVDSVREDGSWPIDTDLATWNTTLAMNALANGGDDEVLHDCVDWLLSCQQTEQHPFTGAAPGGWGWSDLSGAVPDADDTPGALLALAHVARSSSCSTHDRIKITKAAQRGTQWLLDIQNADGGWPTFCRGWGKLPFDRSGSDLTAHALRALAAWREEVDPERYAAAFEEGVQYLLRQQHDDGAWTPLWFGNQDVPGEENPVYGTSKVLLALAELGDTAGTIDSQIASAVEQGTDWLVNNQNRDGGWGGTVSVTESVTSGGKKQQKQTINSGVEETALAVEALLAVSQGRLSPQGLVFAGPEPGEQIQAAISAGLAWIATAVEENRHREPSPIGFYFAKLWYYERLYPLTFTASALGQALGPFASPSTRPAEHAHR